MFKKIFLEIISSILLITISACNKDSNQNSSSSNNLSLETDKVSDEPKEGKDDENSKENESITKNILFKVNNRILDVFWLDNDSVTALKTLAEQELIIEMSKYGDFEQVGSIGSILPSNDENITTSPGDICLYQSNKLVVFYGSNTYDYTKLGHINMPKMELVDLFGDEDVTITITLE